MSYKTNEIPGFDWGLYRSIARKGSGKLSHNTYVTEHDNGSIGVKLHNTEIVRVWPNGKVQLDTGGWFTVTTKQRINAIGEHWRGRCLGCEARRHLPSFTPTGPTLTECDCGYDRADRFEGESLWSVVQTDFEWTVSHGGLVDIWSQQPCYSDRFAPPYSYTFYVPELALTVCDECRYRAPGGQNDQHGPGCSLHPDNEVMA